jgi:hypothetical protein
LRLEKEKILTVEDLERIKNWGEKVFAEACLAIPHLEVEYQVPINGGSESVIDFRVTNRKSGRSHLVEVTTTPKDHLGNSKRKVRQIGNLRVNGEPFCVLTLENLSLIDKHNNKNNGNF